MKINQDMLALLQKQERLFRDFYAVTSAMLVCEDDELNAQMEERSRLQSEIETLEAEKETLFEKDPQLLAAAKCTGDSCRLPAAYQEVCAAARKLQGTLYQLGQLEPEVLRRLQHKRDELEKKIRETNQGPAAKASRFLVGSAAPNERGGRIGKA